jgi:hypothetical protein
MAMPLSDHYPYERLFLSLSERSILSCNTRIQSILTYDSNQKTPSNSISLHAPLIFGAVLLTSSFLEYSAQKYPYPPFSFDNSAYVHQQLRSPVILALLHFQPQ